MSADRGSLSAAKLAPFADVVAIRRLIWIGCDDLDRL